MSMARSKATTAILLVAPACLSGLTHLATRDHLPARIPDPWDWTAGWLDSDGADPHNYWMTSSLSYVFVAISLGALIVSRGGSRSRTWIMGPAFGAAMHFIFWTKAEIISYGATDLSDVDVAVWQVALSYIVLFAYTRLLYTTAPLAPQAVDYDIRPKLEFPPGTRVLWTGQATSRTKLFIVLFLVGGSVPASMVSSSAAVTMLILAGWSSWSYMVRVRINNDGVTVSRLTPWPAHHVSLHEAAAAMSQDVEGSHLIRQTQGQDEMDPRSLIIRTGDTLVIKGIHQLPLLISVDDAAEAADVLNALIARARKNASANAQAPISP